MPPAVNDEARRSKHVHPLINARLAVELARRQQSIGGEDQQGSGPADNLNRKLSRGQPASLLNT